MTSIFDLFQLIAENVWLYGGTFIIVLSLLVFVHEWGHYGIARLCGVRVETFSIGFGKELFGITDGHGTRWKVSLIPLGGYVKMFGDVDPASSSHTEGVEMPDGSMRPYTEAEKQDAFFNKPVWKRAAVVFAGPAINFLFAIVLLAGLFAFYGQPVTPPLASSVIAGSAAEEAGFMPHDRVLRIDGSPIDRFEDIRREVMVALDTPMDFVLLRDGKEIAVTVTPRKEQIADRFGFTHSRGMLGIMGPGSGFSLEHVVSVNGRPVADADAARRALLPNLDRTVRVSLSGGAEGEEPQELIMRPLKEFNAALQDPDSPDYGILVASNQTGEDFVERGLVGGVIAALQETRDITASTLTALGQMITGTRSATELGGIIRIGAIAGDMAQAGFVALISFTALLSINLGLINLFPIPMLDGGHLVFYAVEAAKGSPVHERIQEYAFRFGLAVLVGIMIFANLNDIVQLIL